MMATHEEIESVERPLIAAWNDIRHSRPVDVAATNAAVLDALALAAKEKSESRYGFKALLSENRNHWGTLRVNATVVGKATTDETLKANCALLTRTI
jgi:hypothetical protein